MKKVKNIFALLIMCIMILMNVIPICNSVSAAEMTTNDRIAFYVSCIRNHYSVVNRDDTENYIAILYGSSYLQVLFYDENDSIIYENGLYFGDSDRIGIYANGYPFETYESNNVTHIHGINSYFSVSENNRYNLPENIDYILTNDSDMVLALKNEYEWKNDNVVGGIPIIPDDLFINQFYDESDDTFTFVAIPDKDMYINIRVFYRDLMGAMIYEHYELQSINEVIDGNGPYNWDLVLSAYGHTYPEVFKRHVIAKYVYNYLTNEMKINIAYSDVLNYCLNEITQKDQYTPKDWANYVNHFVEDESLHITGEVSAVDRSYLYLVSGENNVYIDYDESMNMYNYSSDLHILSGEKYVFKIKAENLNCYVGQTYLFNIDFKAALDDPFQQHSMYSFVAGEGNNAGIIEYKDPKFDNSLIYDNNGDNVGYIDEDGKLRIDYTDPEFQEYMEQFRTASDEFNAKNMTGLFNQFKDNVFVYNEIFDIMPGWSVTIITAIMTALGGLIIYKFFANFFSK